MEYENYKINLLTEISMFADTETLRLIGEAMDRVSVHYSIEKKSTELVPYGTLIPDEVRQYIVSKKVEGLSELTLKSKYMMLKNFFLTTRKSIFDLTANDVRLYLYNYKVQRSVSDRTLDGIRTAINSFLEWCVDNEIIEKNCMKTIKAIKYEKKQREALTRYELEICRSVCKNDRERAMLDFMASTGCRCAELTRVKITDINFIDRSVKLYGKGKKDRVSYLSEKALFSVQQYLGSRKFDSQYLFGSVKAPHGKIDTPAVERIFRDMKARVGVRVQKNITPHVIRHTMATLALNSGMPIEEIQMLLGHEDISTTRIYAEVSRDMIQHDHFKYVV